MTANHSARIIFIYDDELNKNIKFVLTESDDQYYNFDCYIQDNNIEHGEFIFAFAGIISSSLSDEEMNDELRCVYNQYIDAISLTDGVMDNDDFEEKDPETDSDEEYNMSDDNTDSSKIAMGWMFAHPTIEVEQDSSVPNGPAPLVETYSHLFGIQNQALLSQESPPSNTSNILTRQYPQLDSNGANHIDSDEEEAANSEPKPKQSHL